MTKAIAAGAVCTFIALLAAGALMAEQSAPAANAAEIQQYLDSLAAENKISGAILVAKDGVPIASKVHGIANRATGAAINLETKFNLGSMNKMFTALAIAQLVEKGRLAYEDTVGKHLPEYANKDAREKVTLHHLLTHTSGMGSYFDDEFQAKRATLLTVASHLPLYQDDPLAFTPGERFEYSNAGFQLLGAIIEKVSGKSYYDYVREHIFEPAGMRDTGFYDPDKETPNLAIGYTKRNPGGGETPEEHDNNSIREVRGGPAGGGFSTVGDLLKFHMALRSHKLVSEAQLTTLTTGKIEAFGGIGRYGYGFAEQHVAGKHIVGHNGGFPGISAQLDMFPKTGHTIAVLMNGDRMMMPVVKKLREFIPAG